jgi:hypothetical protein
VRQSQTSRDKQAGSKRKYVAGSCSGDRCSALGLDRGCDALQTWRARDVIEEGSDGEDEIVFRVSVLTTESSSRWWGKRSGDGQVLVWEAERGSPLQDSKHVQGPEEGANDENSVKKAGTSG